MSQKYGRLYEQFSCNLSNRRGNGSLPNDCCHPRNSRQSETGTCILRICHFQHWADAGNVVKYGCYNRAPLKDTILVQVGWTEGRREMREYPVTMTKDCQYRKENDTDKSCFGCKWQKLEG